jgi:hypothetical protein
VWRLRNGVHPALSAEGGALLDERSGRWTALTPTGVTALRLLLTAVSTEQAGDRFAVHYRIDQSTGRRDVEDVATSLAGAGLLVDAGQSPLPRARWRRRR